MSTKKITALTELAAAAAATDMIPVVDVSDTTDAATGTTKKITATNIGKGIGIGAGNTTSEPVKINTSTGVVGMGVSSPTYPLHVANSNFTCGMERFAGASAAGPGIDFNKSRGSSVGAFTVVADDDVLGSLLFKGADGDSWATGAMIRASVDGTPGDGDMPGRLEFATTLDGQEAVTERMRLDSTGNLLLGGTATPASSVGNLCLFNGTIPAASVTNGVVLYAQDVSTSELRVRDEAGNVSTLSPHNFDLLGERSDPMAWAYYAKNVFVGKEISVDMMKVIRALEKLTGETYIKIKNLKKSEVLDWDVEEEKKKVERKTEIDKAKTLDDVEEPDAYSKKSKPSWMG